MINMYRLSILFNKDQINEFIEIVLSQFSFDKGYFLRNGILTKTDSDLIISIKEKEIDITFPDITNKHTEDDIYQFLSIIKEKTVCCILSNFVIASKRIIALDSDQPIIGYYENGSSKKKIS